MEARADPLATFYRQQPARGPSAVRCSNQQPELSPPHPSCPAALASLTAPRRLGRGQNLRRDRAPAALGPRGRTWTAATTSSLVPLPSPFPACPPLLLLLRLATLTVRGAVDDGRTPGRKAGWTDGLTDEERADRDFYDPKADDDDERWVVENLKHAAITAASSPGQPAAEAASSEPGIGTGGAGPGGAGPGGAGAGGAGAGPGAPPLSPTSPETKPAQWNIGLAACASLKRHECKKSQACAWDRPARQCVAEEPEVTAAKPSVHQMRCTIAGPCLSCSAEERAKDPVSCGKTGSRQRLECTGGRGTSRPATRTTPPGTRAAPGGCRCTCSSSSYSSFSACPC